jgi:hypothetical protein
MSFGTRGLAVTGAALFAVAGVFVLREAPNAAKRTPQAAGALEPGGSASAEPIDAVARLQAQIDSGAVTLQFDAAHGYLTSLLKALNVPVSSQVLVFSKSSEQEAVISPQTPRALYFNDDVYVGWVQGGAIELAAMNPKSGVFLYTLPQVKDARPAFEHHTSKCVGCHDSSEDPTTLIPRLLMLSVLPDREGKAIDSLALVTTDQSPFKERWGGWYVTGTHGRQTHMGNQTFTRPQLDVTSIPDYIVNVDLARGSNVTDLSSRFDTKPYLTPHSDIVALMVLAHQTQVENLMMFAAYRLADAVKADPGADTAAIVKQFGEPIVRALLFSGEAPLTDPVAGTSGFAAEFARQGPRDTHGRSLRDLDLKTRLFRYPLSFVIYSAAFDQMPAPIKEYVVRRLHEVLSGQDHTAPFAHLTAADREAIRAILHDTKPGL